MNTETVVRKSSKVWYLVGAAIVLLFLILFRGINLETPKQIISLSITVLMVVVLLYDVVNNMRLRVIVTPEGVESLGIRRRRIRYDNLKSVQFYSRSLELKPQSGSRLTLSHNLDRFDQCRRAIYHEVVARPQVAVDGDWEILEKLKWQSPQAAL